MDQGPLDHGSPLFAFAGGGSGGHLYPALSVCDAIRSRLPGARFVFYATKRPVDRKILEAHGKDFVAQELPAFSMLPWRWPGVMAAVRRATSLCREQFDEDPPALVLGSGGLACLPPIREAQRRGIPTALLNPDAIPGRANRFLAGSVDAVLVQWEETLVHLPRRASGEVMGCPIRPEFNGADRRGGLERFQLDPERRTLLITGASQGARTVNAAAIASKDVIGAVPGWQVFHLTGDADFDLVRAGYEGSTFPVKVLAYTEHMADAIAASDLVVSRAGASTLAEITAVGRASILMPYPYHRDQHQMSNARCLVRQSAARLVRDQIEPEPNAAALAEALGALMSDDNLRESMASSSRRIGRGSAAHAIAQRLLDLAARRGARAPLSETVEAAC